MCLQSDLVVLMAKRLIGVLSLCVELQCAMPLIKIASRLFTSGRLALVVRRGLLLTRRTVFVAMRECMITVLAFASLTHQTFQLLAAATMLKGDCLEYKDLRRSETIQTS